MPLADVESVYVVEREDRFRQGDILRDITIVEWAAEVKEAPADERLQIMDRVLPYLVVMSQDCDLEQDHKNRSNLSSDTNDKFLQSILICPAYLEENFRAGTHLEDVGLKMQKINSDNLRRIKRNQNYRYHYLPANRSLQVPDLFIDFKHYFTGPRDLIYDKYREKHYLATLEILFRENLSYRFAHYLSRIALPEHPTVAE